MRVTVDDVEVVQHNRPVMLGSTSTRTFEFPVGNDEVHAVVIEKKSKRILGGARKQTCRAFVDGELVAEH